MLKVQLKAAWLPRNESDASYQTGFNQHMGALGYIHAAVVCGDKNASVLAEGGDKITKLSVYALQLRGPATGLPTARMADPIKLRNVQVDQVRLRRARNGEGVRKSIANFFADNVAGAAKYGSREAGVAVSRWTDRRRTNSHLLCGFEDRLLQLPGRGVEVGIPPSQLIHDPVM